VSQLFRRLSPVVTCNSKYSTGLLREYQYVIYCRSVVQLLCVTENGTCVSISAVCNGHDRDPMSEAKDIQFVTLSHVLAALSYWFGCAVSALWYECKALLQVLTGQSPDFLAGLR
jgi:hypothetical protein